MAGETRTTGESGTARGTTGWIDATLVGLICVSIAVTVLGGLIQVSFGAYSMTLAEAWGAVTNPSILFNGDAWRAFLLGTALPEMNRRALIVWNIRVPRVIVGAFVGMNLAVAGAVFQAVTRNELASPYILGVSHGSGLGVLVTFVFFSGLTHLVPLMAAVGGALAFVAVYAIAWNGGTSPVRLVLAGVVVGMVAWSLQRGLFFFVEDIGVVQSALAWITGSLTGTDWEQVRLVAPWSVVSILVAALGARHLNVLVLGESTARSLGMKVEWARFGLSAVAIVATSSAIAVAGIVSFVGLIVPHVVRTVVGSDYRRIIAGSLFVGPALVTAADVGARLGPSVVAVAAGAVILVAGLALGLGGLLGSSAVRSRYDADYTRPAGVALVVGAGMLGLAWLAGGPAVSETQLPVGIVTGLVGGPYFLYLMRRRKHLGDL